jgi:two-component system sporulation sensor kinase A
LAGLVLVGATGFVVAWLLNRDTASFLDVTRTEIAALPPLENLRSAIGAALEDQLSDQARPMADPAQSVESCRAWVDQIKDYGQSQKLILDPQLDIYHWAYLATVKLPERLLAEAELAALERRSRAGGARGRFLAETLTDQLKEETRALNLALGNTGGPESDALRNADAMRQVGLAVYEPGRRASLRNLVEQDLAFWQLCSQAMETDLRVREAALVRQDRFRRAEVLLVLALAFAAGWFLIRLAMMEDIAQAIDASGRNYRILFDGLPVAAFVYDPATVRYVAANPAAEALFGVASDRLVGMELATFVPPEGSEIFASDIRATVAGTASHYSRFILDRAGRRRRVEVSGRHIEMDGRALRLVLMQDITENVAAEENMRRSEARFRALVEDSSEALLLMNVDGTVAYASPSIKNVSGHSPEERVGSHSNGVLHPEDREKVWEVFRRAMADPTRTYSFESRLLHKDGRYIHTSATLRNFLADPNIAAMALNYRDVTAEKAAREALLQSGHFYRALIENSQSMIVIYRRDGSLSYENPAALKAALGYEAGEVAGFAAFDLVHPDDLPMVLKQVEGGLAKPGYLGRMELRLRAKDGAWHSFESRSINLHDNPVVAGILVQLRDITASREAQKQLLRFERLAAIGQIAAGMAHEIRNPLAVIMARAEYLKLELAEKPYLIQELDSILRQGERLKTLVSQVLERSGADDLRTADISAVDLMDSALKAALARFGHSADLLSVVKLYAPDVPSMRADAAQMERVLINLILNAFQTLRAGGALTLGLRSQAGWVALEVTDNGPGVPEEQAPRIFEPFFTTKSTGSGLGLWICKSIVEQHGGSIGFENLKPRGSRFTVLIPQGGAA